MQRAFFLFLLFLFSVAAQAASPCNEQYSRLLNKIQRADTRFRNTANDFLIWLKEHPDATKRTLTRRINEFFKDVTKHLDRHEIAYEIQPGPQGVPRIVITPGDQSLYNRYARGVKKYDENLGIYYDPYQLVREYTSAYYMSGDGIYISLESIVRALPKEEAVRHETIHAAHDYYERVGRLGVVNSTMSPAKREAERRSFRMPGPAKGYANFVATDELITYQSSMKDSAVEYAEALIRGTSEDDIADLGYRYRQTRGVFGRIQERIGEVQRHTLKALANAKSIRLNEAKPHVYEFTLDGKKFRAEVTAQTFAAGSEKSTKPHIEVADIIVKEDASTVVEGERPIGYDLSLSLRAAVGAESNRDVLKEIRGQISEGQEMLELSIGQRDATIAAIEAIETAVKKNASPGELEELLTKLKRASVMRRPKH
jgi:hypothetical protein